MKFLLILTLKNIHDTHSLTLTPMFFNTGKEKFLNSSHNPGSLPNQLRKNILYPFFIFIT